MITDSRGRTIAQIVRNRGEKLIKNIQKEAAKQINQIAKEEVNNISNWSISSSISKTDPDLFKAPLQDKYSSVAPLSVKDAIKQDSDNSQISINNNQIEISLGDIQNLLKLSPRILYFEFGTLKHSEVNQTMNLSQNSINDFDIWQNPYISESKLSLSNKIGTWGFLAGDGKGRFGIGQMVPLSRKGAERFEGIPPVRMYRGSMLAIQRRIENSFGDIIKKAKGKM